VKCPIGVDIGGKAPQEVAVSVAAELLKTLHGR
jgi:xanthine/CO dehydrogenase XdhC/CoxF family maturation factor